MLELVKKSCGIAEAVTVYDEEIKNYIEDCVQDMRASGVPPDLIAREPPGIVTAVTLYVKAYLGDDRTNTEKYLELYRKKVFRLTLEDQEDAGGPQENKDVE